MQTFLPYPDIRKSMDCLDYKRLGQQRREAYQLLRVLCKDNELAQKQVLCEDFDWTKAKGWVNHPASLMWRGYEAGLAYYSDVSIQAWLARGYNNTMLLRCRVENPAMPPWLGDPDFHASHRSNLLRKNPEHYGQFGWTEGPDLPYIWPV